MKAKEFIIQQLNKIIEHVPYIQLRYEYDKSCQGHYVEVLPYSYYKYDKNYIDMEEIFYKKFEELFPNEYLAFLSEKSLSSIRNPEYFRKGSLYDMQCLAESSNYADIPLFTTHRVGNLLSVTAYNKLQETKTNTKIGAITFNEKNNSIKNVLGYINPSAINTEEPNFSGEINTENALAA